MTGHVVCIFFNAGRRTIDQVVRNVLPFMAFVTMLIGIILYTGIGDIIAKPMGPLANTVVGLLVLSVICGLPFLSPILGPGAVIAHVIGVAIIGPQIQNGTVSPAMSLPALFAYNTQLGCDFVPVGLALGEAKPKTIEIGVPAVLLSRQLMGPVLRAIGMVCQAAREAGIWVGLCGEAAARPDLIPTFVRMGITELSMSPASIARAKKAVVDCDASAAATI